MEPAGCVRIRPSPPDGVAFSASIPAAWPAAGTGGLLPQRWRSGKRT